jgi:hypothetical protein
MIVYLYFKDKKNIENCEKMYCSFYIFISVFFMKNFRYDSVTLIPLVLQLGLRMGAN